MRGSWARPLCGAVIAGVGLLSLSSVPIPVVREAMAQEALPNWYTSRPANSWRVFPGSAWSASSVRAARATLLNAPLPNKLAGQSGVDGRFAFSGGAMAPNGLRFGNNLVAGPHLLTIGGGHAAINDTSIVAFGSFLEQAPSWRSFTEPEIPPSRLPQEVDQKYGPLTNAIDRGVGNTPVHRHSYSAVTVFAAGGNRGLLIMAPAMGLGLQPSIFRPHTDIADLDAPGGTESPWTPGPDMPIPSGMTTYEGLLMVHNGQRKAFSRPTSGGGMQWRYRFDFDTWQWTAGAVNGVIQLPGGSTAFAGAILESRDVALMVNGAGSFGYWDVSPRGWDSSIAPITLAGAAIPASTSIGVIARPREGVFYAWTAADHTALYRITPPEGRLTGVWTATRIAPTAGGDAPAAPKVEIGYFVYNRMAYVPGPAEGVVIHTHPHDPVRFWKF